MNQHRDIMPDSVWPFARGSAATLLGATLLWGATVYVWFRYTTLWAGVLLVLFSFLWLLLLYFFRDPNRRVSVSSGLVVSPGDGEVVEVVTEFEAVYLRQEAIRISLFLGLTDVHVQRIPLAGVVKQIQHKPGQFLQAFRPEASNVNEHIAMTLDTEFGPILLKQIAGILARRCVNYAKPGDLMRTGQRFGIIRFGSRLDLYLPTTAQLHVQIGDRVRGGLDPIARLQPLEQTDLLSKPTQELV